MKNLIAFLLLITVVVFTWSCSKDNDSVAPAATTETSLALIVPKLTNGNDAGRLLLLKDGRSANPVSGIANFNTMRAGDKLSIKFKAGVTTKGVVDIVVTAVTSANDSTFVPAPDPVSPVVPDTLSLDKFFKGNFIGAVGYVDPSVTSVIHADTTLAVWHQVSISFDHQNYTLTPVVNVTYPDAGSGIFTTKHDTFKWHGTLTFTDNATNSAHALNGTYNYNIGTDGRLFFYGERNGVNYSFAFIKN